MLIRERGLESRGRSEIDAVAGQEEMIRNGGGASLGSRWYIGDAGGALR